MAILIICCVNGIWDVYGYELMWMNVLELYAKNKYIRVYIRYAYTLNNKNIEKN